MFRYFHAEDGTYIIGHASDIKRVYSSISRKRKQGNKHHFEYTYLYPSCIGIPNFNPYKEYGLFINNNNYYTVVNSDSILKVLMSELDWTNL